MTELGLTIRNLIFKSNFWIQNPNEIPIRYFKSGFGMLIVRLKLAS